jgi:hypothetical protein
MGLLDGGALALNAETTLQEAQGTALEEADRRAQAYEAEVTRLNESVRELSLWLEDINWTKLDGWDNIDQGYSLKAVQENADKLRALLTINPTIKKAINARVGYIWGRGVVINVSNAALKKRVIDNNSHNQTVLFSENAYWKLESQLATDGNIWAQRNIKSNDIALIPISHIGGWVSDEDDPSRVNYWLIQYEKTVTNFATRATKNVTVEYWVPAHDSVPTSLARIDGIQIRRDLEMIHMAVNRQEGWVLGIPDIMAVMFWAKAHKELFEAGVTYTKAQGKFAAKVISKTDAGGQAAAATLRDTPRRDAETGEVLNYGGTAVATGGLDYQLMGKMSGGIDFDVFDPVAGLIAAGLGIPRGVLLGTSQADVESLEQSTVTEMVLRQKAWTWFYLALFGGRAEVVWPKIKTEPEYRRIQSVEIANQSNVLWRDELRQLSLEGFGLDDTHDGQLPPISQQPTVAISAQQLIAQQKADEAAAKLGTTIDAKGQGVATGIGKLSDGKDSKDARNNTTDGNVQGQ